MNYHYQRKLIERYKYFQSKPITELENDEIEEFLNLQKEIPQAFTEIRDAVMKAWENVSDYIKETPEYKAEMKYAERVKQ